MKEIKAIVWDIGGVLLTDPKSEEFWRNAKDSRRLRDLYGSGKISEQKLVEKGSELLGLRKQEFLENYKKTYFSIKPLKQVIAVYNSLNIKTYILSDTNPIHIAHIKKEYPEIFAKTEKSFLSHKIKRRKDSVETFRFLAKKLNIIPEEILFIDNTKSIIDRAESIGMKVIHYKNVRQLKKELKKFKLK